MKSRPYHYSEEEIISLDETNKYLNDRWNKDYGAGLLFSALHDLGEHMFIPITIDQKNYYACYGVFDGLAALEYVNKKLSLGLNLNTEKKIIAPSSFLTKTKAIIKAILSKPLQKHQYLNDSKQFSAAHNFHAFHLQLEWDPSNSNLTAYFLNKFSRYCMKKFSSNTISRWQISINVKGEVKQSEKGHVNASFFSINCEESDTPESMKTKLTHKLKSKEYLGFWYLSLFLQMLGAKLLTWLTKKELEKKESSWFGLFTNLGDIGGDGKHEVLFYPTVRWHRPIAAIVYKHNKKIYLTVLLHHRLGLSDLEIGQIKNELRAEFI